MRTIRIYQPGDYETGQQVELYPEASQHVGVVLRMKPGDGLILFSGNNFEFSASIQSVKKNKVVVTIESAKEVNRESPISIHLAQGISKGYRMEMVIQKAVELGVSGITPILSQHCAVKLDKERLEKKCHQWQAIAIAACEQSGRNWVPVIHSPEYFEYYIQNNDSQLKFLLNPEGNSSWRDYHLKTSSISLIIGPEGGLSDDEITQAKDCGFQSLSLGPRILRTETAAIAALSLLQAVCGDL